MNNELNDLKIEYCNLFHDIKQSWIQCQVIMNLSNFIKWNTSKIARLGELYRQIDKIEPTWKDKLK